ncbi:MAG: aldehyde-activating protein [Rhizobiales bacterium]|nr:aldehyde-activating protein [Hyphomicrobiales bacterium]MBA69826.1 aldehyde-activating protein [Hyphomicrobiales bacterium]|tara:strand:+ start:348 stop:740 length:393 start_codon:yes stop_codon:yes gene_type:complete
MDKISGGCLCGKVRFTATGKPWRVGICHCLDCRKHSGSLFGASAIFPTEAVATEGETRDHLGRHFCPECGSSVFGVSDDEIEIALGAFDAPDQFMPSYELWSTRREAWLPDFALPHHYERNRTGSGRTED